jgi:predicted O-linked N-acetylglucosamine transferase (SPINDLY family)
LKHIGDADLYYLAGLANDRCGDSVKAIDRYKVAVKLGPRWDAPANNLGCIYDRLGNYREAISWYQHAIDVGPESVLAYMNAARTAYCISEYKERALAFLDAARAKFPDNSKIPTCMAFIHVRNGDKERAATVLAEALALNPVAVGAIVQKVSMCIPVVYRNMPHVDQVEVDVQAALTQMEQDVSLVEAQSIDIRDEFVDIWSDPLFYLAYNGRDNSHAVRRYAGCLRRLMLKAFGNFEEISRNRHRDRVKGESSKKIRIAFVTAFLNGHSVWKAPLSGLYDCLDRDKFEIFSYYLGAVSDQITQYAVDRSEKYQKSGDLREIIFQISQDCPDIIIYPEIGMNFNSVCLSTLRLAPIQATMVGHPVTSGSACIDYYFSSDMMESQNSDEHYTESLVRLPGLGSVFTCKIPDASSRSRRHFGLSDQDTIFLSPQSVYKYLPEDDDIYPRIIKKNGGGKFVFLRNPEYEESIKIFEERLRAVFEEYSMSYDNHVIFIKERLSGSDFVALCKCSDVFVDNPSWSGMNTTLDALHSGCCVATVDGQFMRQKHTAAIMRYLGFESHIAMTKGEFVEICVRFAKDEGYRSIFRELVSRRLDLLKSPESVRFLEKFLCENMSVMRNKYLEI